MRNICIVVADGARARFFTIEWPQQPEFESGPDLVEQTTLAAPAHDAPDSALYTEGLTGRNRTLGSGTHDYDEHRGAHDDEVERRFVRDIVVELGKRGADECILCAEPQMLGFLRKALDQIPSPPITEVPKDLTHFVARDLQVWLASEGLIPERRPPGG